MRRSRLLFVMGFLAAACSKDRPAAPAPAEPAAPSTAASATEIVVYSGRSESLVGPIFNRFEEQRGVKLKVKYGDPPPHAPLRIEEGEGTPAAAYFAQDVGAVGALEQKGLLATLPKDILDRVAPRYRSPKGSWVGVTGRVRTIVYNPTKVKEDELPASVADLTSPRWKGKIGWAPQNASFQVFVTGLRVALGEASAEKWLRDMKANEPRDYPKNGAIVQAVGAGTIELGLVNHYYLLQLSKDDPSLAAKNHYTAAKDPGSLVNLAAFAIPKGASEGEARAAQELARYLLTDETQRAFVTGTYEYPLVEGVAAPEGLRPLAELESPTEDLGKLHDLEGTLALLRKTGVLP